VKLLQSIHVTELKEAHNVLLSACTAEWPQWSVWSSSQFH